MRGRGGEVEGGLSSEEVERGARINGACVIACQAAAAAAAAAGWRRWRGLDQWCMMCDCLPGCCSCWSSVSRRHRTINHYSIAITLMQTFSRLVLKSERGRPQCHSTPFLNITLHTCLCRNLPGRCSRGSVSSVPTALPV